MSVRTPKATKTKRASKGVTTVSFDAGEFIRFTSTAMPLPSPASEAEKPSNGKTIVKRPSVSDRRNLRSIEIFLNNCVNLAGGLEDKRAAKILRLLREARDQAIRLRG